MTKDISQNALGIEAGDLLLVTQDITDMYGCIVRAGEKVLIKATNQYASVVILADGSCEALWHIDLHKTVKI